MPRKAYCWENVPGLATVSGEIMDIRVATDKDRDGIKRVYLSAFPKVESEIIAKLAIELLSESSTPQTMSLIADTDGSIVGHVAFSPVAIDNNENCQAYILAPLAVQPVYQKRRIGSTLIEYGIQQLSATGVNIVFVYGDPKYYGKFGFNADAARNFLTPYKLQYPTGWQAIVLNKCAIEKTPAAINCVSSFYDPQLW